MSTFRSLIHRIHVEPHPNADRLDIARIGGYCSAIPKGALKTGDLAAYIPESALVPEWLQVKLGVQGLLAGKQANRVKAISLRGVLSQGLVLPLDNGCVAGQPVADGDDVTALLELTKYVPTVPKELEGDVTPLHDYTISYEIEDIKAYPDALLQGELVEFTEKIHGVFCCLGIHPKADLPIVASKGLCAAGLVFNTSPSQNEHNIYVQAWREHKESVRALQQRIAPETGVYVLGEIYGPDVQDLTYGQPTRQFRAFDICICDGRSQKTFLAPPAFLAALRHTRTLISVPVVGGGPWAPALLDGKLNTPSAMPGPNHIREGVVIRPLEERHTPGLGRVILKAISDQYLLRKGATEYQ